MPPSLQVLLERYYFPPFMPVDARFNRKGWCGGGSFHHQPKLPEPTYGPSTKVLRNVCLCLPGWTERLCCGCWARAQKQSYRTMNISVAPGFPPITRWIGMLLDYCLLYEKWLLFGGVGFVRTVDCSVELSDRGRFGFCWWWSSQWEVLLENIFCCERYFRGRLWENFKSGLM